MAVRTNFELIDIVTDTADYSIHATDINGDLQEIISRQDSYKYMTHKYGTRQYSLLRGSTPATQLDAISEFLYDFRMWVNNRQHNIDKLYQSMFDYNYSPIENVDRYESETIDETNETNYGHTTTESGTDRVSYGKTDTESGTDRVSYGKTDTESGTTAISKTDAYTDDDTNRVVESGNDVLTKTGDDTTETKKAGFNSPATYTKDTETTVTHDTTDSTAYGKQTQTTGTFEHDETATDTTTHGKVLTQGGTDSTTYGKTNTQGGTDSTTYGKTDTESGTDTTDHDSERILHVHGNIGVTSNVQLLTQEQEYRMQSLAEMLLDNFINDYTFYA